MGEARVVLSFARDEKYCRHSEGDFIRLKDGGILFIYTRFKGKKAGDAAPADLAKRVSYDNGETWTEAEEIVPASMFGVQNIMSVSMLRMLDGDIGLFFIIKQAPGFKNRPILMRSSDEGKTFRFVCECGPEEYWVRMGMNNARVIRLSSGRIVYPLAIHPGEIKGKGIEKVSEETAGYFSYSEELGYYLYNKSPHLEGKRASPQTIGTCMYSDDDGYTLKRSAEYVFPPFTAGNAGIQEGEIYEICPGVIKCLFRTDKMYQYESMSLDDGDHWTVPQPSIFTGPCSPISLSKNLYSGKIYAFWNPIPVHNGRPGSKERPARSPLAVAEVGKNLSNLEWMDIAEEDRSAGYAYTAIFYTNENEALIAYCAGKPTEDRGMLCRLNISRVCLTPAPDVPKSIF